MSTPKLAWGPTIVGSGVSVPAGFDEDRGFADTDAVHSGLSTSQQAYDAGQSIIEQVRVALRMPLEKAVRTLGFFAKHFPEVVLYEPEFHAFMDRLVKREDWGAVDRILGDAHRGRKRENPFFVVGAVDVIRAHTGWSAARAARWIAEKCWARFHVSARSIENTYACFKDDYDRYIAGRYVPAGQLTYYRWKKLDGEPSSSGR